MPEKKTGFLSGKRLLLFILIWGAVIAIGLLVLYFIHSKFSGIFEADRPEAAMDQLLEEMSIDEMLDRAMRSCSLSLSPFEDTDTVVLAQYSDLGSEGLSYRRSIASSDNTKTVFILSSGDADIFDISFTASDKKNPGFGKHYWSFEGIAFHDVSSVLSCRSVEILVPVDGTIYVNSIPVDDSFYVEDIPCPCASDIESRFDTPAVYRRFVIDCVYGDISVSYSDGGEFNIETDADGADIYIYVPKTYSISLRAPEDIEVYLCGALLTREDASAADYGILSDYIYLTNESEYETLQYEFDQLCTAPEVKAYDSDGDELSPVISRSGRYIFFHNDEVEDKIKAAASGFFESYIGYPGSDSATVGDLLDLTHYNSALYLYISDPSSGTYPYISPESIPEVRSYSNFRVLGGYCCTCTVLYETDGFTEGYELLLVRTVASGFSWVVAEINPIE